MILTVNTENNKAFENLRACVKAVNALDMEHSEFSWGKGNALCVNGKMKQFELSNWMGSEFDEGGLFQAKALTNAMQ